MNTYDSTTPGRFCRFHTILTAKPGSELPPFLSPSYPTTPYGQWTVDYNTSDASAIGKRKRDMAELIAGPSGDVSAVTRRRSHKRLSEDDHEGQAVKEPTTLYRSKEDLLNALAARFKDGGRVEFHGSCKLSETGITHKQRIQTFSFEIWKATGYRFTVKDHPQVMNGHKTRFWCSQDDAHRSKSSKAARIAQGDSYKPRVTSTGEVVAKARFPCKSRLLISSRDSEAPGTRTITIRMYHHIAHDPYVDNNLPQEVAKGIWESSSWLAGAGMGHLYPSGSSSMASHLPSSPSGSMLPTDAGDENAVTTPDEALSPSVSPIATTAPNPDLPDFPGEISTLPVPTNPPVDDNAFFHKRMRAHIKNLREFCDGLEYQLQFNDFRMLEVVERDGGSFLQLVEECLQKEGRLAIVEPTNAKSPEASEIRHSPNPLQQ